MAICQWHEAPYNALCNANECCLPLAGRAATVGCGLGRLLGGGGGRVKEVEIVGSRCGKEVEERTSVQQAVQMNSGDEYFSVVTGQGDHRQD